MITSEALTALAAVLCLFAVVFEFHRIRQWPDSRSLILRSPLFLPLYAGGILQWCLFGIAIRDYWLISTCLLQLLLLTLLGKRYWRVQHHDS